MNRILPTLSWTVLLVAATGCGGTQATPERLSVAGHEREAQRHDAHAAEHEAMQRRVTQSETEPIRCYDQQTPDPDSGGEGLHVLQPCWTPEQRPSQHHGDEAAVEREEAARHRAVAATMLRVERESCAGLGAAEISHSPFFHRTDIVQVQEVRRDGELRGARVTFRKVQGLDSAWMRRALACHQARAAVLGYAPDVMSYCPIMVAPTSVEVEDLGRTIAVTVTARSDWEIAAVVGRAKDLLAAPRAAR